MTLRVSVDSKVVLQYVVANVTRKDLPTKTGAPNPNHGFDHTLSGEAAATLSSAGKHKLDVDVYMDVTPTASSKVQAVARSPICFQGGVMQEC